MAIEKKIFSDFLKKRNLTFTKQREKILNIFLKTETHFSVEEFYDIVKIQHSGIGQTTVFRTLKLLRDAGLAREVEMGDKKVRYEHKYGHKHHDHLICTSCGKIIEAADPNIESFQNELCQKFGFTAQMHRLEIFGICSQCSGNRKTGKEEILSDRAR